MKVLVYQDWIVDRLFLAVFGYGVTMVSGMVSYTLLLFITAMIARKCGHEFSHAAATVLTGGTVDLISLGPGYHQHIDFTASSQYVPAIYFAGAAFDTVMIGIMAYVLFTSPDIGIIPSLALQILAGLLCIMMVAIHIPSQSDFGNTIRSLRNEI